MTRGLRGTRTRRLALGLALTLTPTTGALLAQGQALEPAALVESAWTLLPTYDGAQRSSLTPEQRRNTLAAAHLLAAALALEPSDLLGWWRRAHACALLAEDDRTRGHTAQAERESGEAREALERALALDPGDPWSHYSLGVLAAREDPEAAIAELDLAIAYAAARIEVDGPDSSEAWLSFKAREWLAECLMRAGRFERARAELASINAEFGENVWPLHIALAECCERERDFAGARVQYEAILADEEFSDDPQAYALLGYLEGLVGNAQQARLRLRESFERERVAAFYPRLWLWILAPDEREVLGKDLTLFLEFPPDGVTPWDVTLGRFVLGSGSPEEFLLAARTEQGRRLDAGQPLDDLLCEAWFYAGLRHEVDALAAADESSARELRGRALRAYEQALALPPIPWKWEWAYARLFAARLERGRDQGQERQPAARIEGEQLVLTEPGSAAAADASRNAGGLPSATGPLVIEYSRWHLPGAQQPLDDPAHAAAPGDLLMARVRDADGRRYWLRLVF